MTQEHARRRLLALEMIHSMVRTHLLRPAPAVYADRADALRIVLYGLPQPRFDGRSASAVADVPEGCK